MFGACMLLPHAVRHAPKVCLMAPHSMLRYTTADRKMTAGLRALESPE